MNWQHSYESVLTTSPKLAVHFTHFKFSLLCFLARCQWICFVPVGSLCLSLLLVSRPTCSGPLAAFLWLACARWLEMSSVINHLHVSSTFVIWITFSSCFLQAPNERARLYFLLAWFHAVIQERLRYAPLGWSKKYEFGESDLRSACDTVDTWLDDTAKVADLLDLTHTFLRYQFWPFA